MNRVRSKGMHILGTLINCSYERLLWEEGIYKLLQCMPKKIGMNLIDVRDNPIFHVCKNPNIDTDFGITGVALLWESHFSIHTWPYYNELDFDLFSCKDFDYEKVIKILKYFFKGEIKGTHTYVIKRGNKN